MNQQWSRVAGAVSGVLFALLIFLSVASVDPLRQASDAELLDWWSDKANLDASVISMYTRLLAIPFLLAFLVQLRLRLRARGWSELVSSSGLVFAAALAVSGLTRGVTALSVNANNEPLPGVDALRFMTELAFQAYGIAAIGAWAITVGIASGLVLSGKALPSWLGWLGLATAIVSLAGVAVQAGAWASPLLMLWILAASFCLARAGDDSQAKVPETTIHPAVPEAR